MPRARRGRDATPATTHRPGRHPGELRHVSLRRADLVGLDRGVDGPWRGLPGVVSVRAGRNGALVAVDDEWAGAVRAAESALARLSTVHAGAGAR